jgi:hypothetical protein
MLSRFSSMQEVSSRHGSNYSASSRGSARKLAIGCVEFACLQGGGSAPGTHHRWLYEGASPVPFLVQLIDPSQAGGSTISVPTVLQRTPKALTSKNFVRILCPPEGSRIGVGLREEAVDRGLKLNDRAKRVLGELGKTLDRVQP